MTTDSDLASDTDSETAASDTTETCVSSSMSIDTTGAFDGVKTELKADDRVDGVEADEWAASKLANRGGETLSHEARVNETGAIAGSWQEGEEGDDGEIRGVVTRSVESRP